jgi:F-type H+-transporting ATPase subunit b
MAFAADPSFWVLLAFMALGALVGKRSWISLTGFLDVRSEKIQKDIEEAQRLKEEAEQLREHAIHLQHAVNKRVQEMMAHTKIEIQRLKEKATQEIEAHLTSEEHQLSQKIMLAEQQALNDIEKKAIQVALNAAKSVIQTNMNDELHDALLQNAMKRISDTSFSYEPHL